MSFTLVSLIIAALAAGLAYALVLSLAPSLFLDVAALSLPAVAVLFGVFFLESSTSAMTPRFSRNQQLLAAAIASLLVMLCALTGSLIHDPPFKFVVPQATPQPTATPVAPPDQQIIFILDKSYSMSTEQDRENIDVLTHLISELPDTAQVGVVDFSSEVLNTVSIAPLTQTQRQAILDAVQEYPSGGTDFDLALDGALQMLESSQALTQNETKLFLLTDGFDDIVDADNLLSRILNANAQLYCIELFDQVDPGLARLVTQSNGSYISVDHSDDLLDTAAQMIILTPSPEPAPIVIVPDVYDSLLVSGIPLLVVLLLRGLIVGITLTLMLSVEHQFRLQLILSPLCGLVIWVVLTQFSLPPACFMAHTLCGLVLMNRNQPR